jgi:5-methyltetrahydrofolate--homocysteine methyltransferase
LAQLHWKAATKTWCAEAGCGADIRRKHPEAGSDIIETNSFGSTPLVLAEYGLAAHAYELSRRAAELARQATQEFLCRRSHALFVEGGVDLLLVLTCQDTWNIKAALLAIQNLAGEIGAQLAVIICVTIEPMSSMFAGQTITSTAGTRRGLADISASADRASGQLRGGREFTIA